ENKIYAKDSDKGENNGQLARYLLQVETGGIVKNKKLEDEGQYFSCPTQNIELYYLTLDGHEPQEKTFTTLDNKHSVTIGGGDHKYTQITYMKEIETWLDEIILNIYNREEHIRTVEIIQQYLDALHCVSPNVKLNQDMFDKMEKNESYIDTLKKLLSDDWVNLQPEQIEEKLKEKQIDEALWSSAIFLLNNHKHLYWHALNDFFIKLQDELHFIFGDYLLPREIDKNTNKEKTIDKYVSEIVFEDINASKLSPMYYRIRLKNGEEWTLQPDRSRGFFLGIDCTTKPNKEHESSIKSHDLKGYSTKENGWYAVKYLEDKKEALNLWDFTQGQTFDLLDEERRQEIAEQYAAFVEQELNKIN
ncbi:MAG: PD-(D/E)XK nuclease family protein, partial [Paludibacteraceae bacterium]|nr:PD-(D/E)XK nuclease family protein [Paludibacteraceae bacterium]